jgi:hypothetical protein
MKILERVFFMSGIEMMLSIPVFWKNENSKNTSVCSRSENLNLEEKNTARLKPRRSSIHYEKITTWRITTTNSLSL